MANTQTMDGKQYLQWGGASGRDVYYEVGPVAVQLEKLERNIHRCFHHRTLYNRLKTLKDTTSIFVSQSHSKHTDRRLCRMNIPGSQVNYFLKEGAAFITRLVLQDSDYRYDASLMRTPGPYRLVKKEGQWGPDQRETRVSTLHASVNGEVENLQEVLLFMPAMIKHAHGGEHEVTGKGKRRGFTHLYMPGKNSKEYGWRDMVCMVPVRGSDEFVAARQSLVEQTAACIELAARAKEEVKWTIQGSGSDIFCDAAEYVIQHHPDLGLERQSAHFSIPIQTPCASSG